MKYLLISLGSNIQPQDNLPNARYQIAKHYKILFTSHILENPPCGDSFKSDFHNQLLIIRSDKEQTDIKAEFEQIELLLGREPKAPARKLNDRTIDIDILGQGDSPKDCCLIPLKDSFNQSIMQDWKLEFSD